MSGGKTILNYKTNVPDNFKGNDYYYEANYDKDKWEKRLFNKTLKECRKRTRTE